MRNMSAMDEATFWKIIALFDWDETGDDDAVMAPARAALLKKSPEAICAFDDVLAEKLYALDTRAHCRAAYAGELDPDDGDEYVSADDFLYLRCAVVANGREFYEAALRDPKEMPREIEFESLLSLAVECYEEKTGKTYEHTSPLSYESFSNREGWQAKATARTRTTPRTGRYTRPRIPVANRRPTE